MMMLLWFKAVSGFISSLKWPLLIITFFIFFKKPVSKLIGRIKSINFQGSSILCDLQKPLGSTETINSSENQNLNKEKFLQAFNSPIIHTEQENIRAQIKEEKLSSLEALNILIYQLSCQNLNVYLLYTELYILPSQISLLEYLNKHGNFTVSEKELQNFCDSLLWYSEDHLHNLCIAFLLDRKLIENNDNGYYITIHGKEYLSFRVKLGNLAKKPLPERPMST